MLVSAPGFRVNFARHSTKKMTSIMQPILNIAVRAARKAGTVITRAIDQIDTLTITQKGRHDFVSEVDRRAEDEIIRTIRKAYPSHGILAEESGELKGDDMVWIVDPLDGTTNFLHGFPQFAVSIGIRNRNRLEHGLIYDPLRDELFTASIGEGAQLNGRRLRVSKTSSLDNSLLGTGFPFREASQMDEYLAIFRNLMPDCSGIRRAGAASLDLAYVAAGRLDGFWEFGLKPWDMAAGAVIIQEAGGLVGDARGANNFMQSGDMIAGNPKIFAALLQRIEESLRPFAAKSL